MKVIGHRKEWNHAFNDRPKVMLSTGMNKFLATLFCMQLERLIFN